MEEKITAQEFLPTPVATEKRKVPLTSRVWAKTAAFVLAVVMVCVCGLGVLAAAAMVYEGIYTTPKAQYRDNAIRNLASGDARSVAQLVILEGNEAGAEQFLRYTNIRGAKIRFVGSSRDLWAYEREEDESLPVVEGAEENRWDAHRTFRHTLYWCQDVNQENYLTSWEKDTNLIQTVEVSLYFGDRLTEQDDYWLTQTVINAMYYFRYSVYIIIALSAVLAVACFVFLMCAAGRHPDYEGVRPGWGTKIPIDAMSVGVGFLVLLVCELIQQASWNDTVTMVVVWAAGTVVLLSVALGWCMSFALRVKLGGWWKNSLCWWSLLLCAKVCRLCWRGVRACCRLCGALITGIPLVWKAVVLFVVLSILELFLMIVNAWNPSMLLFWICVEKCLLFPMVVAVALMLRKLERGGKAIAEGDLTYRVDTRRMLPVFRRHGENLNSIGEGMNRAVEERTRSERMKTELITNVSHDIKTPLTSIINYADLIGRVPCENETITGYADVLHRQSVRLKRLIDDLVEASKASSGNLEMELTPCEVGVLLTQTAGEYEQRLQECGLQLVTRRPDCPLQIMADGRRLWRVFDNLMNNVCKYAQEGTRVYLTLEKLGGQAIISVKNTSREELNISPTELMERFVRGDASRRSEGSGLGLSIARSLTELQRGSMDVSVDGDLFKVVLKFPLIP